MRTFRRIKRKIKQKKRKFAKIFKKVRLRFFNSLYVKYYNSPVDSNMVLITSKNGSDLAGNMLRTLMAAADNNTGMRLAVAARKKKREQIRNILNYYGLSDVKIVIYDSLKYYKWLETSKYLFCDSTLPARFIKRPEQVYVNTWHGTPLKMMGNDSKSDRFAIGNVQKNFLSADILAYPSDYCRDTMMRAYNITDIYKGEIAEIGYPRNGIFFDEAAESRVRKEYGLEGKKIYVYMPTFREANGTKQRRLQADQIAGYMETVNENLREDEILYVKMHVFNSASIDFSEFTNIREFPQDIETYEFLNAADVLISDYSSVMYDFANTGKTIVRFVYDEDEYYSNRGMYDQPVEMPFPKAYDAEGLIDAIRKGKTYDDTAFREAYCKFDSLSAAVDLVDKALNYMKPETSQKKDIAYYYNGRLNPGIISDNLDRIIADHTKKKSFVAFSKRGVRRRSDNFDTVSDSAEGVLGVNNYLYKTAGETIAYILFSRFRMKGNWIDRKLDAHYEREHKRLFTGYPISEYVFYQGLSLGTAEVIAHSEEETTIYAYYHWLNRGKPHVLKRVLSEYDKIVACDEEMIYRLKDVMKEAFDESKIHINKYYLD